jgi:diguanylate cyclase (GGDEF)-like protein
MLPPHGLRRGLHCRSFAAGISFLGAYRSAEALRHPNVYALRHLKSGQRREKYLPIGFSDTGYQRSLPRVLRDLIILGLPPVMPGFVRLEDRVQTRELSMPEATGTQLIRQRQELSIFHDVAKALTSSLDLDSILQTIMEKMAEYFRPDTWSLLMVDEQQNDLYFAIAVGDAADALKNVRLKVGEGIAGWVAKHGEQVISNDVESDPRFAKRIDEVTQWETRSVICVPLKSRLRVLGVIQLVNVDMSQFNEPEVFFLQALCDYAAIAIENARWVEKIQELTITDDCTGLYNARHLYKTLETEVYRSSRFAYEFSVLFIDLDHFKSVNDTHGHLIGSKLLAEIGYLVKAQLRLIDFAFRYGGDEFVILLPQTGKDQALVVAKRLRDGLRASCFCRDEGLNLNVRASIGLATYPHDARDAHEIIRQADEMMYVVKNSTRDNIGIAQRGVMK